VKLIGVDNSDISNTGLTGSYPSWGMDYDHGLDITVNGTRQGGLDPRKSGKNKKLILRNVNMSDSRKN